MLMVAEKGTAPGKPARTAVRRTEAEPAKPERSSAAGGAEDPRPADSTAAAAVLGPPRSEGAPDSTGSRSGQVDEEAPTGRFVLDGYIKNVPDIAPSRRCDEVIETFAQMPDCECVVVCDAGRRPIGLVMKNRLAIIQTHRFGPELYYNRSIVKLMDGHPLTVEKSVSPQELIGLALGRGEQTLYDAVIVTEEGRYAGVLSMSALLELSRMLQRDSARAQIEVIGGTEAMLREIEGDVADVLHAARRGNSMSERMVELTLQGKEELDKANDAFAGLTANAAKQEEQIGELQERAASIGQVSKLIRELADQCNLLAVNATIEAARAGEHGRGFGVVADEVRRLAVQTKKSADRINDMIRAIMEAVGRTAALVGSGRSGTANSRVHVEAAFELFEQLFHAAADNRGSAAEIGRLAEQASARAGRVASEMKRLADGVGGSQN